MTCVEDDSMTELMIYLKQNYTFSFLNIISKKSLLIDSIVVDFMTQSCLEMRNFYSSATSRDVYCNPRNPVRIIRLKGAGVSSVCDVHVSGGRNFFAGLPTSASLYLGSLVNLTVDGVTPTRLSVETSKCLVLGGPDSLVMLNITLDKAVQISRVNILISLDVFNITNRPKVYQLSLYDQTGTRRFRDNITRADETEVLSFVFSSNKLTKKITIQKMDRGVARLCDVEAFGDCALGTYGLGCLDLCRGHCLNDLCSPVRGLCSQCPRLKYGDRCQKFCAENCQDSCFVYDGKCTTCKQKYYGSICNESCSDGCKNDGSCNQINATCTYGCFLGFTGPLCEKCPTYCSLSEETCDAESKNCLKGCNVGRYGSKCDSTCSIHCKTSGCNPTTGACISGCQSGFFGAQCNSECSRFCLESVCNSTSGNCSSCVRGRRGDFCHKKCSSNCYDDVCDKNDGSCSRGCKAPFAGKFCNDECQNCGGDGECSQTSKVCVSGCVPGYEGESCLIPTQPSVVLPFLLISFCLISSLVSIIYLCHRRNQDNLKLDE
ncbi:multiple epidermal growth factor domains protein 6 [Biomphalaria glabrata]|nr:multiple epidermal growth factor domains protein 6 [Biomphalaria glabrata]